MPSKADWRAHVSTCNNVFVFQAALLCEDCGEVVMDDHDRAAKIHGQSNEPDYPPEDSDDYPQGPHSNGGGESDTPEHCDSNGSCDNAVVLPCGAKIGCPLGNPLTNAGAKYVNESIVEDMLVPPERAQARQVGRLWAYLFSDYLGNELHQISALATPLPSDLIDLLAKENKKRPGNQAYTLLPDLFLDPSGYIYGGGYDRNEDVLWRVEVDPLGNYQNINMVSLPREEIENRGLERALKAALDDGAFD